MLPGNKSSISREAEIAGGAEGFEVWGSLLQVGEARKIAGKRVCAQEPFCRSPRGRFVTANAIIIISIIVIIMVVFIVGIIIVIIVIIIFITVVIIVIINIIMIGIIMVGIIMVGIMVVCIIIIIIIIARWFYLGAGTLIKECGLNYIGLHIMI